MKTCRKCLIEKPLSDFYKEKSGASGVRGTCKACDSGRHATRYTAKAVQLNAYQRERRLADPSEDRARSRAYYLANRDKLRAYHKEYDQLNRLSRNEKSLRNNRRYQEETKVKAKRSGTRWEPWEDAFIMDDSRTVRDVALELGRTYKSVSQRRVRLTSRFMNTETT